MTMKSKCLFKESEDDEYIKIEYEMTKFHLILAGFEGKINI